jgi:hypothetical protein
MRNYASVAFSDVKITGRFWSERLDTVLSATIPSQYAQLKNRGMLESLSLPKPVPPLPSIAQAISGKTYVMENNAFGLRGFSLSFKDKEASFRMARLSTPARGYRPHGSEGRLS